MTSTNASSSEINIRHAEFKDVESICNMLRNTFTITFGHTVSGEDLNIFLQNTYSTLAINAELMDPAMTSLVAVDSSQPENIIGFAQLLRGSSAKEPCMKDTEKAVEMYRLYVDTSFHKRGVGSRLMKELERIAKDEGFLVMWLGVDEHHPYAKDVYRRRGYERVGQHPFKIGSCIQYDWVVKKQL